MKLRKGKVVKDVPENLVALYLSMGWSEVKESRSLETKETKEEETKGTPEDNGFGKSLT